MLFRFVVKLVYIRVSIRTNYVSPGQVTEILCDTLHTNNVPLGTSCSDQLILCVWSTNIHASIDEDKRLRQV